MKVFPSEVLLYQYDEDRKGNPIFAAAVSLDEIPEYVVENAIGVYSLDRVKQFKIIRSLT